MKKFRGGGGLLFIVFFVWGCGAGYIGIKGGQIGGGIGKSKKDEVIELGFEKAKGKGEGEEKPMSDSQIIPFNLMMARMPSPTHRAGWT